MRTLAGDGEKIRIDPRIFLFTKVFWKTRFLQISIKSVSYKVLFTCYLTVREQLKLKLLTLRMSNFEDIFGKSWKGSDVVIVIKTETESEKEKRLHVHSNILSFSSPVFEELLNEVTTGELKEIELVEKNYDDIVLLVKNLYPQYECKLGKSFCFF